MTDWEQRARELLPDLECDEQWIPGEAARRALQLGREMANTRAEEIAKACDDEPTGGIKAWRAWMERAAAIARSTVKKPEPVKMEDLAEEDPEKSRYLVREIQASMAEKDEARIRADERERIVERIDAYRQLAHESGQHELISGLTTARIVVRDAPGLKPKTRGQVLEEALREIENLSDVPQRHDGEHLADYCRTGWVTCREIARRALKHAGDNPPSAPSKD